jgi:hypothetical protein
MLSNFIKPFRGIGTGTLAASLLALGAFSSPQASEQSGPERFEGLVGTWHVQVTPHVCAATTPLGKPFDSLLTFGPGGTLVETTANPAFLPGQRTSGHGFWERIGHDAFRAVSESFILFDTPVGRMPSFTTGRQRIEQGIELTAKNRFTSEAAVYFQDKDGNKTGELCATAVGTMLE